jgi:hypothetical protein
VEYWIARTGDEVRRKPALRLAHACNVQHPPPLLAEHQTLSDRPIDTSQIDIALCNDVVDLAPRDANILEFTGVQIT